MAPDGDTSGPGARQSGAASGYTYDNRGKDGRGKKKVPVYCYQCVAGPDLLTVEVDDDGYATKIESNYAAADVHPAGGRVCVKAYGLIQKTYNPDRIKQPMKRTNPEKGQDVDPGWEPIGWDEALDLVAERLNKIVDSGDLCDDNGHPKLAWISGGGGIPVAYQGAWTAFLAAWGEVDQSYGAGQGVKCTHSEHLYGELWHRAFTVAQDTPLTRYIISCGQNMDASGGVQGVWRGAEARGRGMRRVYLEPHMGISASTSDEWVPIRPKTDAAFLFALINVIVHEHDWRQVCDIPHLRDRTASPYLVGPKGFYLRHPNSEKPLCWDSEAGRAVEFDAEGHGAFALDGTYTVGPFEVRTAAGTVAANPIEIGGDGETWTYEEVTVPTSFQMLLDHTKKHTPEWAAEICDVPVDTIRRVGAEFLESACVGETVEIEGRTMPFRPVAVVLGKTVNNGWGGYECCWARTILVTLVGALEVPGGMLGTAVRLNRPATTRQASVNRGADGFMTQPFNATSKREWQRKPATRSAHTTLSPLVGDGPWAPALGPAHFPWMFQKKTPDNWPRMSVPEIFFVFRTNPAISSWDRKGVTERLTEFPFMVCFAYTFDETNWMADILLPEATDLESTQLYRIGGAKYQEVYWEHNGWALRQPALDLKTTGVDIMDMTEISTQLAVRTGILDKYNDAINKGALSISLSKKTGDGKSSNADNYDYSLPLDRTCSVDEIFDAVAKAGTHVLSDGEEVHGLDYFKSKGYYVKPISTLDWYLHPAIEDAQIRYELPYQERIKRIGVELGNRLHEEGVEWWNDKLVEYTPLPEWHDIPGIWESDPAEYGKDPEDYPFWLLTTRSMQYSWGSNVQIPLIREAAENVVMHKGVVINATRAAEMGIADGDEVTVESAVGETSGRAVVRHGIRPDTLLMVGQMDHWKTPFAKNLHIPSLNSVIPMSMRLTDSTGSSADIVRVSIRPAK